MRAGGPGEDKGGACESNKGVEMSEGVRMFSLIASPMWKPDSCDESLFGGEIL